MSIVKFFRVVLAAAILFAGLTQTARADFRHLTGDTSTSPTFHRPTQSLLGLSADGTNVHYNTYTFQVSRSGSYNFYTTGLFDTFHLLYEGSFNPASPLTNAIAANDDLYSDTDTGTSGFYGLLESNTTYVFVITGYDNNSHGRYEALISGPGLITAVPEPSAYLMLGLGLAGIMLVSRRKNRQV
ncbi:PEP-CTERM sorting domain-containing protein [Massilia sp. BJB1822]|uniref:PEP-CTERM sorting domain-containing protein n=1 Tax=Massilia sp. BJB1822 TaxID=2744470 RepID=UPI001594717D|nr:PEP-CTERM sorting domain-containing protein [Massilia sp. BJB1822]NVE01480.1 PEP-CTERM sorting domain-containing protein [Massilia sp. BJB1822]